jgi:hypothetical protein
MVGQRRRATVRLPSSSVAAQDPAQGPHRLGAGFSELSLYGGWPTTATEYVVAVKRYDREIGNLEWAAGQDMMTEDVMLARTGLTILDHQRATVANFVELQ